MSFLSFILFILILGIGVATIFVMDLIPGFSLTELRKMNMNIGDSKAVFETINGEKLFIDDLGFYISENKISIKSVWVNPGYKVHAFSDKIEYKSIDENNKSGKSDTYNNKLLGVYTNAFTNTEIRASSFIISENTSDTIGILLDSKCNDKEVEKNVYNITSREYNMPLLKPVTTIKECRSDADYKKIFELGIQTSTFAKRTSEDQYIDIQEIIIKSGTFIMSFKESGFNGEFKLIPSFRRTLSGYWEWSPKSLIMVNMNLSELLNPKIIN